MRHLLPLVAAIGLIACTTDSSEPPADAVDGTSGDTDGPSELPPIVEEGTIVAFDLDGSFSENDSFFDFPWPSDLRLAEDGTPDLSGMTRLAGIPLTASLMVAAQQRPGFATIPVDASPDLVRHQLQEAPWGELFVIDEKGHLFGTITFSDLHEAAFDTSHDSELSAGALARKHPTVLKRDDDLETAVRVYGATGDVHLPVVDAADGGTMLGVVHEHEVMLAYHRALDQARGA